MHSAVSDPSKIPVDQPSPKRARIETLSRSKSNSRDGGAQQNDQLDTTRSDGLRMQVNLGGMSTHGQELESGMSANKISSACTNCLFHLKFRDRRILPSIQMIHNPRPYSTRFL